MQGNFEFAGQSGNLALNDIGTLPLGHLLTILLACRFISLAKG